MVEALEKGYTKYFFIALFFLIIYVSFLIVQELIGAIISAMLLGYLFYPVYEEILKRIHHTITASLITIVIILLILFIPMVFVTQALVHQAQQTYAELKSVVKEDGTIVCDSETNTICALYSDTLIVFHQYGLEKTLNGALVELGKKVYFLSSQFVFKIPKKLLQFFVMLLTLFYMFIDGKKLYTWFFDMLPLKKKHAQHIMEQIKETTYAVMYGQVVISLLQGVIATAVFFLFGIPHALLLGVIMTILAILPMVGVGLIWLPTVFYFIITGLSTDSQSLVLKGIGLLILYGISIWPLELILKPRIIGDRAKLHSLLIFIGVVGGIAFFGALGMILGPLILSILVTMVRIYWEEHHHEA